MSPALQCFAPQAATAAVDATLKANKPTSANANNDFMNKAPFRQANRTRQLLSCTGRAFNAKRPLYKLPELST